MRRNFTLFTCLAILLTFSSVSKAQVSAYLFSESVTAYTEIVGGTLLGTTTSDDQRFVDPAVPLGGTTLTGPGFPIGFNFTYNGVVFDRVAINNNGWISLGQSALTPSVNIASTSSYTPLSSTTTITPNLLRNRIAGMGRDIIAQAGASLRIQTIGSAPNRSLVVQWKGYRRFGVTGDNFNFQIILNESGNTVQVKFGTISWSTTTSTSTVNHVGLGGSVSTDFNNRMTTVPHNYNNSSAGTLNTSGMQNATSSIAVTAPTVGRTFTWFLTPPQDQCAQNFDGGAAMPTGWSAITAIDCASSNPWAVVNSIFDSAPNSAFVNGPNCYSEEILESRVFAIVSPTAQLSFRRNVNLETGWDGMILEIKIGAGAFQDIITAGEVVTGPQTPFVVGAG